MNQQELKNQDKEKIKKADKRIAPLVISPSSDKILNTLADIIIERILEESKNGQISVTL